MFMKKSKTFSFFSIFILLVFAFNAYPQKKSKIVYKYKKFEKINVKRRKKFLSIDELRKYKTEQKQKQIR